MTKNTRTTTKTIVTTYYTAIDGTDFLDEKQCEEYEKSVKCTIAAAFNKIPKGEMLQCGFLYGGYDDNVMTVIRPRNFDDVKIINMHCGFKGDDLLTQDDIGKDILLECCCSTYWYRFSKNKNWEQIFVHPIVEGFKAMFDNINNYGFYEVTAVTTEDGHDNGNRRFEKHGYQLHECKNLILNEVRRCITDNKKDIKFTITVKKDGETVNQFTQTVKYNDKYGDININWE